MVLIQTLLPLQLARPLLAQLRKSCFQTVLPRTWHDTVVAEMQEPLQAQRFVQ